MNRKYNVLILFLVVIMLCIVGCQSVGTEETAQEISDEEWMFEELKKVVELYRGIYEQAIIDENTSTLRLKREIIDCLGEKGYSVVDNENLIDMKNSETVEKFVEKLQREEDAEVTFYQVMENGGLVRYDLSSIEGKFNAVRSSLVWRDAEMSLGVYEAFEVKRWHYTKKGYLFLEQYFPEGYDGSPGQIGIRVKPLDENLRELNQNYVIPIGYGCNNFLITDWDETDCGALDFYDLFDIMYRMKYGGPYSDNGGVEAVEYWIPAGEFEAVIQTYMDVAVEVIREKTFFDEDKMSYRYRPRTMDDMEMPYGPEPEVVACEEQENGTLKLVVEAVWIREFSDCVVTSELTVRPMSDGSFRYVSNKVVSMDAKLGCTWRKERLTNEEWETINRN